ncbi:hypothetical protein [Cohnella caldifontis]|uniref:hypothetical protein n=1 Tax=Cohnella caldifontis TaxID=3027471 RepID=UPI0023EBE5DD|nr:hypothetical protein [Cohnella sp. YIM B05605]
MRSSKRGKRAAALLVVAPALLSWGCSRQEESESPKSGAITVTPIDLSEPEYAEAKTFLGSVSGAVRLRYEGDKPKASLELDIWQNGDIAGTGGSIADLFSDAGDDREIELILSTESVQSEGSDPILQVKTAAFKGNGYSTYTMSLPWDPKRNLRGSIEHAEAKTFGANEPAPIWGMQAAGSNGMETADFSQESLSRVEWGLIFTLRPAP